MSDMSQDKQRPRGMAGIIWTLEHAQDVLSGIVGVMLVALAVVVAVFVAALILASRYDPAEADSGG